MSVATLKLSWEGLHDGGWNIEICGGVPRINMFEYKFKETPRDPSYMEKNDFFSSKQVRIGKTVWVMSPEQNPNLGWKNGARQDKPPIIQVHQYLEALEKQEFSVVASHSISSGLNGPPVCVWTLNLVPERTFILTGVCGGFIAACLLRNLLKKMQLV